MSWGGGTTYYLRVEEILPWVAQESARDAASAEMSCVLYISEVGSTVADIDARNVIPERHSVVPW
jgi:hypothetical protein